MLGHHNPNNNNKSETQIENYPHVSYLNRGVLYPLITISKDQLLSWWLLNETANFVLETPDQKFTPDKFKQIYVVKENDIIKFTLFTKQQTFTLELNEQDLKEKYQQYELLIKAIESKDSNALNNLKSSLLEMLASVPAAIEVARYRLQDDIKAPESFTITMKWMANERLFFIMESSYFKFGRLDNNRIQVLINPLLQTLVQYGFFTRAEAEYHEKMYQQIFSTHPLSLYDYESEDFYRRKNLSENVVFTIEEENIRLIKDEIMKLHRVRAAVINKQLAEDILRWIKLFSNRLEELQQLKQGEEIQNTNTCEALLQSMILHLVPINKDKGISLELDLKTKPYETYKLDFRKQHSHLHFNLILNNERISSIKIVTKRNTGKIKCVIIELVEHPNKKVLFYLNDTFVDDLKIKFLFKALNANYNFQSDKNERIDENNNKYFGTEDCPLSDFDNLEVYDDTNSTFKKYDFIHESLGNQFKELLNDEIIPNNKPVELIFLACGRAFEMNYFMQMINEKGLSEYIVHGIDYFQSNVEFSKKVTRQYDNVHIHQGDLTTLASNGLIEKIRDEKENDFYQKNKSYLSIVIISGFITEATVGPKEAQDIIGVMLNNSDVLLISGYTKFLGSRYVTKAMGGEIKQFTYRYQINENTEEIHGSGNYDRTVYQISKRPIPIQTNLLSTDHLNLSWKVDVLSHLAQYSSVSSLNLSQTFIKPADYAELITSIKRLGVKTLIVSEPLEHWAKILKEDIYKLGIEVQQSGPEPIYYIKSAVTMPQPLYQSVFSLLREFNSQAQKIDNNNNYQPESLGQRSDM